MKKLLTENRLTSTPYLGAFILIIAVLLTLPWLGLGHFYTRGEPREALVAVAMMDQGNYILPFFQGDFAFKPPMLHWLISLFSLPQGYVSEYSARFPSALAEILMAFAFFTFYAKRINPKRSFLATLLMLTCFEVHRAAMTCRVDMVLMAFTVGEIMALYKWYERGLNGLPILASVLASGAILTKGPVGVILPAFALTVFLAINKVGFWKIFWSLTKLTILSSILPAMWYIAAYAQGGEKFLNLVIEENFGRFLGKMSYESHEHGPLFTIPMLLSGLIPFTLILLFGLFTVKFSKIRINKTAISRTWDKIMSMDKVHLFALVTAVCIFIFYCIPKSKRSVYLLPMYPFVAILMVEYIIYLYKEQRRVLKSYSILIAWLASIYSIILIAIQFIDIDFLGTSRSQRRLGYQLAELQNFEINAYYLSMTLLPLASVIAIYLFRRSKYAFISAVFVPWTMMTITLDAIINPALKNCVPDYYIAEEIKKLDYDGRIYFYCPANEWEENIFTVDYYLNNRTKEFSYKMDLPKSGYILVKEGNIEKLNKELEGVKLIETTRTANEFTSFRGNCMLFKFSKE